MFYQLVRSSSDPRSLAIYAAAIIIAFVVGIGFHEFSHVLVAYLLGDTTGRDMGRLTLNPLRHLDPFGSMMLLLVGFGWGKPAPVNPYALKTGPRTGWSLVIALAGPVSNFLVAGVLALFAAGVALGGSSGVRRRSQRLDAVPHRCGYRYYRHQCASGGV